LAAAPDIAQILFLIDTAFDRVSWHGPNLRGSLRGVTRTEAAWRPAPGRHNIWELVVHAAYWKYVARRRLTGAPRGSFALDGSNWLSRPTEASERAWRSDLRLLDESHAALRSAVASLKSSNLRTRAGNATRQALVTGIAAHDLYHAGQIQLLKRLQRERHGRRAAG
jgi:hypothetical protein